MAPQADDEGERRPLDSSRLIATSRELRDAARAEIQTAQNRIERTRNVIQVSWLWRAFRERYSKPKG